MKKLIQTPSHNSIKTLLILNLIPQALKLSSSTSLSLFNQTYTHFLKSGHPLNPILSTTVLHNLSNSNSTTTNLSTSHRLFLDTHTPDLITYNALISGYAKYKQTQHVFDIFHSLRCCNNFRPDVFTLSSLVKACEYLDDIRISHGVCFRLGFVESPFIISGLIGNYMKCGDVGSGEMCFKECFSVDNVVWSVVVSGYVWNGEFKKAKEVFGKMRGLGLVLNEFSLTSVVGALFDVKEGGQVHGISVKMGLSSGYSTHLNNSVMNMYVRCGCNVDAVKVFEEMSDPDVVSWTERIGAACDGAEAMELFKNLYSRGVEVNEYTMINLLSAIGSWKMLLSGMQIQALCIKVGYIFVTSIGNAFVYMYGKCGQMDESRRIFDEMICPDLISWNSLIDGYSENGLVSLTLSAFSQMCNLSIQPNKFTLAIILEVVSNSNSPVQVMQIHTYIIKLGFRCDDSMVSCLITAYGKNNVNNDLNKVFNEVDEVSVVHLNAMASTLVHAGVFTDALKLFVKARALPIEVDSITFSIALKASGALTDLEQGKSIHSLVLKSGYQNYTFVESAIIDVYSKCGNIHDAENAFRTASQKNLAAWNAMVMGYAQHNRSHDVFELFNEMSASDIEPDEITYLGVLKSCCHAGFVEEAYTYLISMYELHGVKPRLEHYACMIDLLGRVGLLQDAKRTIDEMHIYPDAQIWQILLSACVIHRNVDLGTVAARKLLELQPENDSAYVLLSNLYASAGMWSEVGTLRIEMREKTVCKEVGSSWTVGH